MSTSNQSEFFIDEETLDVAAQIFDIARNGPSTRLSLALAHGCPVNLRNDKGDTLLMLAAYNRNEVCVEILLGAGADPNIANNKGQTPLGAAAYQGNANIVDMLIKRGAKLTATSSASKSSLMLAAMFNRAKIVHILLDAGADPNEREVTGLTALDMARAMGAGEALAILERIKQTL